MILEALQRRRSRHAFLLDSVILALTQLIVGGAAGGQTKPDLPQFDAVSIRPTPSADDKILVQTSPDSLSFHGAPIRTVIETAFGIDDKHLAGAPPGQTRLASILKPRSRRKTRRGSTS